MTPDQLSNLGFSIVGGFLIFLVICASRKMVRLALAKKAFVG
jgi:hypothetical protein